MNINKVTLWPGFRCTLDKSSLKTTCQDRFKYLLKDIQ